MNERQVRGRAERLTRIRRAPRTLIVDRGVGAAEGATRWRRSRASCGWRTTPCAGADPRRLSEVSREMADDLFAVERSNIEKCPEWSRFLVEVTTEHVAWQSRPTGVLNGSQAEWLIARVDEYRSIGALAILVDDLVEAHRVPQWFAGAAHARIRLGWPGTNETLHMALAA
jgi:hypothetical protein